MGRSSGAGGLLALLALIFILRKPRELAAADFIPTFTQPFQPRAQATYEQYFQYVTKSEEDIDEDVGEALVLVKHPIKGRKTQWLTVNGKIPTPSGGLIPIPAPYTGPKQIDVMLQPIEEAVEQPHFQDIAGAKSINLRLKPI